jgi:NTP pyrophosphatase (non-canonical NTP hydrolase)
MDTLDKMQQEVVEIFKKYDAQGTKTWSYDVASHDLQYQVGNLSKCVLQLQNYRYREGLDEVQIKAKLSDELADIMAEVLFIAHELDIDLHSAWANMLASDQKKISERS